MHPFGNRAAALLLALFLALPAACSGTQTVAGPELGSTTYRGHMAYVGRDAQLVVSMNHLVERAETVSKTKTFAKLEAIFAQDQNEAELAELMRKAALGLQSVKDAFPGRVTMVVYEPVPGAQTSSDDEELVIIVDGDAEKLLQSLASLDDQEVRVTPGEGEVYAFQFGADEDVTGFYKNSGGIAIIAGSRSYLDRTMELVEEPPTQHLTSTPAFERLTADLKADPDIFFYLANWETSSSGWESMVDQKPTAPRTKAVAATAMLDAGIDLEVNVEFDERDFDDPDIAAMLPAMRAVNKRPTVPEMLPEGTLAYFGMNVSIEDIDHKWLADILKEEAPPYAAQEFASMFSEFIRAFDGEIAIAVTDLPAEGAPSHLLNMTPVPGVVVVGKLADPNKEDTARKILEALLQGLTQGTDPMLKDRRVDHAFGSQVVLYSATVDPAIELGYAFHGGYLTIGTRHGVLDVLEAGANKRNTLAKFSLHRVVADSLAAPSNYSIHIHAWGIYEYVRERYGPMIGMVTEGMAGGDDNVIDVLLRAFPHVGGRITFKEKIANLHLYITAEDH